MAGRTVEFRKLLALKLHVPPSITTHCFFAPPPPNLCTEILPPLIGHTYLGLCVLRHYDNPYINIPLKYIMKMESL